VCDVWHTFDAELQRTCVPWHSTQRERRSGQREKRSGASMMCPIRRASAINMSKQCHTPERDSIGASMECLTRESRSASDVHSLAVDEQHDCVLPYEEQVFGRAGGNGNALVREAFDGSGNGDLCVKWQTSPVVQREFRPLDVEKRLRHAPRR
jgi:hypothetical protein